MLRIFQKQINVIRITKKEQLKFQTRDALMSEVGQLLFAFERFVRRSTIRRWGRRRLVEFLRWSTEDKTSPTD